MEITNSVVLDALNKFGLQSEQAKKIFLDNCVIRNYNRNEILFSENKNNRNEYFLIEGVLQRFNIDENGNSVTTGFYIGSSVITPNFVRIVKNKSLFTLQALTDIYIAEMPVSVLDNFRYTNKEFEIFGLKVLQDELSKNILTDIVYRSSNAKERLLLLRKTYPNLENLIPHSIIASYLGITNVSFSRLRNKLAGK